MKFIDMTVVYMLCVGVIIEYLEYVTEYKNMQVQ